MLSNELDAAARAVAKHMPPGAGDFTVRTIARAALEAAEKVRIATLEKEFGPDEARAELIVFNVPAAGDENGEA